jgi:hypothetical protein
MIEICIADEFLEYLFFGNIDNGFIMPASMLATVIR